MEWMWSSRKVRNGHFKHESSPFRLLKKTRQLDAPKRICLIYCFFLVYLSSLLFPLPSFFLLFLALRFCWIVLRFFGLGLSEAVFLSSPSRSPPWDNFLTSVYLVITSVSHCNRLKLLLLCACLSGMGDLLFPTGLPRALLFPTGLFLQSLSSNF